MPRIDHVAVESADPDRAAAFYERVPDDPRGP
jgi:catechol 2,3-dioxygenase-like lactoylglutathione lyase family enzyme